jgi:hypothetical protein
MEFHFLTVNFSTYVLYHVIPFYTEFRFICFLLKLQIYFNCHKKGLLWTTDKLLTYLHEYNSHFFLSKSPGETDFSIKFCKVFY